MTRIKIVKPKYLSDKHLGAEYRELPRIFGLVRKAIERNERPSDTRNPSEYVLGKGHCRFFYPRLAFLEERYRQLCRECRLRGRTVNYGDVKELTKDIPKEWFGEWIPDKKALMLNIGRIQKRGGLRKLKET